MYNICHIESSKWCADKLAFQEKKKALIVFATLCGGNISTVANFKLSTLSLNMELGRDVHRKL